MKKILLYSSFLLLSFCSTKNGSQESNQLEQLNWAPDNYRVLNQLIKDYGKDGVFYNRDKPPYAVLDWDQTCAFADVEEAVMRYQLFNFRFKMSKSEFAGILLDNINGINKLSQEYNNISLADINHDLISDYNYLFDMYLAPNSTSSLDEIKLTTQYKDFVTKIPYLYEGYCSTAGIGAEYGYPWVLYMFAGHSIDEVKNLAQEAISFELTNIIKKDTITSPGNIQTKSGVVSYIYTSGLRVLLEMQNLISTFFCNGIDVFIVSASYKPVVEMFSGMGKFGYNIPTDNVIGMELETNSLGKILPQYKTGWVKTNGQGKVEAINIRIKGDLKKNWDPIFSAADSDGDYEMSTRFPDMKLTLIWNRLKGGNIGSLCIQAVEQSNTLFPRYILQGRDENTGTALPSSSSILFGKNYPQLLR